MRKYMLASICEREEVDLRDYEDVITEAVHEYSPDAKVMVESDCYYVDPTPSRGTAVKIGKRICCSELRNSCIIIYKLFSSIEIEGVALDAKESKKSKHAGGHH